MVKNKNKLLKEQVKGKFAGGEPEGGAENLAGYPGRLRAAEMARVYDLPDL
jgi:hypothetical protein